MNTRKDSGFR